jgi:hypothetical protein
MESEPGQSFDLPGAAVRDRRTMGDPKLLPFLATTTRDLRSGTSEVAGMTLRGRRQE